MHTVQLKIEDNIYPHIMFFLKNLKLKGFEVKEIRETSNKSDTTTYDVWSQQELKGIGKIGFDSNSFTEDSEDYSKW